MITIERKEDLCYTLCSIINLVVITFLVIEILVEHNEVIKEHSKSHLVFYTLLCISYS